MNGHLLFLCQFCVNSYMINTAAYGLTYDPVRSMFVFHFFCETTTTFKKSIHRLSFFNFIFWKQ